MQAQHNPSQRIEYDHQDSPETIEWILQANYVSSVICTGLHKQDILRHTDTAMLVLKECNARETNSLINNVLWKKLDLAL